LERLLRKDKFLAVVAAAAAKKGRRGGGVRVLEEDEISG